MKTKQVEKNIRRKVAAWISTLPPELRKDAATNVIVTGGCIVSLLLDEKVNDYDMYFKDNDVALKIADHYIATFIKASEDAIAAREAEEAKRKEAGEDVKAESAPMSFPGSVDYLLEYVGAGVVNTDDNDEPDEEEHTETAAQPAPSDFFDVISNSTPTPGTVDGRTVDGPNFSIEASIRPDGQGVAIYVQSAGVASGSASTDRYQYFEGAKNDQETEEYVDDVFERTGEIKGNLEKNRKNTYQPIFISSNAITLSDGVQLVFRFTGSPREIHTNYDFVHCTNYWTVKNGLTLRKGALAAILGRELIYSGSKYPVTSLLRVRKFIRRGWHITAGQMLKIILQIGEFDLTDPVVLKDQLIGVDFAYFAELLDKIKDSNLTKIDRAYVVEIIDKMDSGE